jgi:hypothetical protein
MWQLKMTNTAREWIDVGDFETVQAAARRIREIEEYTGGGLFLEMHIEFDFGSDEESFGHLEHNGKRALYVVKRQVN